MQILDQTDQQLHKIFFTKNDKFLLYTTIKYSGEQKALKYEESSYTLKSNVHLHAFMSSSYCSVFWLSLYICRIFYVYLCLTLILPNFHWLEGPVMQGRKIYITVHRLFNFTFIIHVKNAATTIVGSIVKFISAHIGYQDHAFKVNKSSDLRTNCFQINFTCLA